MNLFYRLIISILFSTASITSSFATNTFGDPNPNQKGATQERPSKRQINKLDKTEPNPDEIKSKNPRKDQNSQKECLTDDGNQDNYEITTSCSTTATDNETLLDETFPNEILFHIFSFLGPKSLSRVSAVSKKWNAISNEKHLWKNISTHLSFLTFAEIPNYKTFVTRLISNNALNRTQGLTLEQNEALIELGSRAAMRHKIHAQETGHHYYEKDIGSAVKSNDQLVEKDEPEAINNKYMGLTCGLYGYKQDLEAGKVFISQLLANGNKRAWKLAISELAKGGIYYSKNPNIARTINDILIKQGDSDAMKLKIRELDEGGDIYTQDLEAAKEFIEQLYAKGDSIGIKFKIVGMVNGWYGYEKDPAAAFELNEKLADQGNMTANLIKLKGLFEEIYGYTQNIDKAEELCNRLVAQGIYKAMFYKLDPYDSHDPFPSRDVKDFHKYIAALVFLRSQK